MQDSQLRGIIGLALVVVVLVGLLSVPDDENAERGADEVQVLTLSDLSEVVGLELVRAADTVSLVRSGDDWTVNAPYEADADNAVVDRALDDLREMAWGEAFQTEGAALTEFGLGAQPVVRVTVHLADGTAQTVDIGEPAPVGWHTYAQLPTGQALVVPGRPGELLADHAETFRDRRLFQFEPQHVRTIRIEGTQGTLSVQGQGTNWFIEGYTRAEPDLVDDLVLGLLDLRFDKVLSLDNQIVAPRYTVTVGFESGPPAQFLVGDTTPMGVIVQAPAAAGVVFPQSLALITQGPADLGMPNVLGLHPERDDTVEVRFGGNTWQASRTDSGWSMDGVPDGVALQHVVALSLLEIVYQLEQAPPVTEVLGEIRVQRNGVERTVQIGQEIGDGLHTAVDPDGGAPFRVRAAQLSRLQPPAAQ